jgi:hypothetical protein
LPLFTNVRPKGNAFTDDLFGEKSKGGGKNDMSQSSFRWPSQDPDGTMAGDVGFEVKLTDEAI